MRDSQGHSDLAWRRKPEKVTSGRFMGKIRGSNVFARVRALVREKSKSKCSGQCAWCS